MAGTCDARQKKGGKSNPRVRLLVKHISKHIGYTP